MSEVEMIKTIELKVNIPDGITKEDAEKLLLEIKTYCRMRLSMMYPEKYQFDWSKCG